MKSFIYNKPIYLLLFSLLLSCLHTEAQVRVVDNKGTISTIPINWTRVTGTTKDIYNTDLGNVGVGIIKPMATFHNSGSTILGAKAGNTTLSSSAALIYADYTVFNYSASTSGVTLSLPATMTDATAGRLITITNTGTTNAFDVSFSAGAVVTLPVGYAQSFVWNGTVWTPQSSPVAISVPISGLTAATKSNSIDNTNYAQTWNWSNADIQNPLTMNASSLTSGNLLSLTNSNALHTGSVLNISSNTTAGTAVQINTNSLSGGKGLSINSTGTGTVGNLFYVSSASTSNFASSGNVSFNFAAHTGSGVGINDATVTGTAQTINASSAIAGTGLAINAAALTTGNGLNVMGGSVLTSGSLLNATASVNATTTKGLLNISNTAASSTGTVATIQANSTAGSGLRVLANGNVGVGTAAPTAALQLQAGTSAAGTAPLKLTSSGTAVLLTTPETGAIEFDGTHLYCTIGGIRYQLDQQSGITGEVKIWAGTTTPTGWLVCDGASVSRTTYANLFAAIGVTYGSVDGTSFNLPNLNGRVPAGYDASQTEFNTLGKTSGEKAHTLSIAEMPSHNHGGATSSNRAYNVTQGSSQGTWVLGQHAPQIYYTDANTYVGQAATLIGWHGGNNIGEINTADVHNHTINSQGGGTAFTNLQPYITMNYIIKY